MELVILLDFRRFLSHFITSAPFITGRTIEVMQVHGILLPWNGCPSLRNFLQVVHLL